MLPEIPPPLVAALADAPFALTLVWMIALLRRDLAAARNELPPVVRTAAPAAPVHEIARDELVAFKLEVARTYVPLSLIRDLDARLTKQLGRLEEKLDEVSRAATAAAAVAGQSVPPRRIGFGIRAAGDEA
ncbi:MAG TPA: hypothetical protein VGN83_23335 [Falsiroseomonas sp.]|jgi:hypothetical protein|nr:hypothetical protein [Falsiroseomonas sp.]